MPIENDADSTIGLSAPLQSTIPLSFSNERSDEQVASNRFIICYTNDERSLNYGKMQIVYRQ